MLFWIVLVLKSGCVILDCVGAEEWRRYFELCLALKGDGVILDCVWC